MTHEVLSHWEDFLRAANRSEETIKLRRSHVRRALSEIDKPLPEVTCDDLTAWLASHQWSPSTRRSHRASLVGFVRWAAQRGLMTAEAAELPSAPVPRGLPRPAADSVILDALRGTDERVQLMIELMAYGGLRRGEVAKVHPRDLTGEWLKVVGKGGHVRMVPLPPFLCAKVRRFSTWLFPGAIDGHLSARRVGELVSAALPEGVTGHKLRHRYATTVYRSSGDIRSVQELLGHAKLETTAIYVGIDNVARMSAASTAWKLAA